MKYFVIRNTGRNSGFIISILCQTLGFPKKEIDQMVREVKALPYSKKAIQTSSNNRYHISFRIRKRGKDISVMFDQHLSNTVLNSICKKTGLSISFLSEKRSILS